LLCFRKVFSVERRCGETKGGRSLAGILEKTKLEKKKTISHKKKKSGFRLSEKTPGYQGVRTSGYGK